MKKLALISALAIGGLLSNKAEAQIGINLGFHFGSHRVFAPVARVAVEAPIYQDNIPADYNDGDDYYYLPDVGAYYNVAEQCYYYNDGGNWISAAYLPGYRNYDWRNARRFEVRARRPYLNDRFYSSRFGGNAGNWNHNDNREYADRGGREGYRPQGHYETQGGWNNRPAQQDQRFDRGRENGQPAQENRGQDNFARPQMENRGQGNFGQMQRPNYGQDNRAQQAQPNQGNNSQPSNGGRDRGNNGGGAPAQENRGQGSQTQPSNGRGGNNGGGQHISENRMQGGGDRFGRV